MKDKQHNARVLVIGKGGREHALAWKLAQCPEVSEVFIAPGNGGTALEESIRNLDIADTDYQSILNFAKDNAIDLTVVGPELPLADGLVDLLHQHNLLCCGPMSQAAQLESSKQFCKEFLQRHGIATASSAFFSNYDKAASYLDQHDYPLVIKADGLAAGKGVVIAQDQQMAEQALRDMLLDHKFGDCGVLIEQFLEGEEVSFIVLTDGISILPLASSKDHKKRDEGDKGPNTGGMGAYSPVPLVDESLQKRIMNEIIKPTIKGLAQDGIDYRGFLYAGLMINAAGKPLVLEYNCRLGDPETQALLMRIESGLYQILLACATQELASAQIRWKRETAICIVLAASNYPYSSSKDEPIEIRSTECVNTKIFHAGTRLDKNGTIRTYGGRVLGVTSLGVDIAEARSRAYATIELIDWDGKLFRKDIGSAALLNQNTQTLE